VGEEAKLDGTLRAAKRIHHKLFKKIKIKPDTIEKEKEDVPITIEESIEGPETETDEGQENLQEIPEDWKFKEYSTYIPIENVVLDEKE
jgi:hypothetical protein